MQSSFPLKSSALTILLLTGFLGITPVFAQPIVSDQTTGTIVTPHGNQIDISGGTLSGDGANLFHSFQQFGLNAGGTANFLSNPSIQNILGRVTGGDASIINGLIQVTGGNSHLYLMNPVGIIFGTNATLNVPASFTATTATGIGFNEGWFNAVGNNNYAALVGAPSTFIFNSTSQAGAIVNAGHLTVNNAQNLALLGGTVVNTGQLVAPQGTISTAAVPNQNLVRITQPGNLLSLEVKPLAAGTQAGSWTIPVLSLPQLLTGGDGSQATGLTVNANGQVELTASRVEIPTETGTAIASGTLDVSTPTDQGGVGGNIDVLGNQVGLIGANVKAFGTNGGGSVRIGGDYQGKGKIPNASHTFVSADTTINANALSHGNGGRVIAWADQSNRFLGQISARGGLNSGNGGFAEVSGKQSLNFRGLADLLAPAGQVGMLLLDPTDITISNEPNTPSMTFSGEIFSDSVTSSSNLNVITLQNQLALTNVTVSTASGLGGAGNITVNTPITWDSGNSLLLAANNDINISSGNNISYSGGELTLAANNNINLNGNITLGAASGNLTLQANNNILLNSGATVGTAGSGRLNVTLNADRDGNGVGVIAMNNNTSIRSNNGDIILGGGSNPQITPAASVNLSGATLNSGQGNLSIAGNSVQVTGGRIQSPSGGITIMGTSGSGEIVLNGGVETSTATGKITLRSSGSINTTGSTLIAPNIALTAVRNITTGAVRLNSISGSGVNHSLNINTPEIVNLNGEISTTLTNGADIVIGNLIAPSQINVNTPLSTLGGNVGFTSTGAIAIYNPVTTSGGNITLRGATIDTRTVSLDTSSNTRNGGAIALSATVGINTADLISRSAAISGNGGRITLTSNTGDITTGKSDSSSSNGIGGTISLTSEQGAISSTDLIASGVTGAGDITLNAGDRITASNLYAMASNGPGGAIGLTAAGDISTGTVTFSLGVNNHLKINTSKMVNLKNPIFSNGADIVIGDLIAPSQINLDAPVSTLGGNVSFTSTGAIAIKNPVTTAGGNIFLSGATIDTKAATLDSRSSTRDGGAIALSATGDINTADLNSGSTATSGNGGSITLTTKTGDITTGKSNSSSSNGNGGAIKLTGGAIDSGDLDASGATGGGNITVEASKSITTGAIDTSSLNGKGGDVKLDPPGDIQVTSINTQGGSNAKGGNVDITTDQFFRATGTFSIGSCINTSICSSGGAGGGSITIRHGGNGITAFDVGDATRNGTAGALISNGGPSVLPFLSLPYTYTNGVNINIISVPAPSPSPSPSSSSPPLPYSLPLSSTSQQPPLPIDHNDAVATVDKLFTNEFRQYLKLRPTREITLADAQDTLRRIDRATGVKPAIIYAVFVPSTLASKTAENASSAFDAGPQLSELIRQHEDSDQLELILVTPDGPPIRKRVPGTTRQQVLAMAAQLRRQVTDISSRPSDYVPPGQSMYQWLVAPLESDLKALGIQNLVFILDAGLRSVPLPALHDGHGFLVEKYSVGLMPSLSLTDTRYQSIKNSQVLAMGASKFTNQTPLPAVPVELSQIMSIWKGESFLNKDFTLNNLKVKRRERPFGIVHLATHAFFQPGELSNSYIQLSDGKLGLDQLRQLGWNDPAVQLLILSACQTAQGNEQVELGFAGLAVQAGAKSALASLSFISDEGTMALMTEFYEQLQQAPIKAEALRRAQVAMLKGEVKLENGQLITPSTTLTLPPELNNLGNQTLSHPKFWAAFTVIGNPW